MSNNDGLLARVLGFWKTCFCSRCRSKKGFTLTEILISLAIVAVIAVLVLPVVTTRAQNRSFAVSYEHQVKQMLNSLEALPINENKNDITQTMMYVENATDQYSGNAGAYINKYMKVAKYCGDGPGDCFAAEYYEYKNNDRENFDMSVIKGACAQLANGVSVCLKPQVKSTTGGKEEIEGWIDLNGPKAPNVYGRDLRDFSVNLKHREVFTGEGGKVDLPDVPVPCEGDDCNPCSTTKDGYLEDGKTKDLARCCDYTKASLVGTACCGSEQGKKYDNETEIKTCCNLTGSGEKTAFCCQYAQKNTEFYNTCHSCSPTKIGYLDDGTKDLTRCCDFTKASIVGTECCKSQGKGFDNTDQQACCNTGDSGTKTEFCCQFATKGTNFYNTCHSCSSTKDGYLDDGTKDLTRCCDFKKASLVGTECCKSQGKGFNDTDQKACCNTGDSGTATDFCCPFATQGTKFYETCNPPKALDCSKTKPGYLEDNITLDQKKCCDYEHATYLVGTACCGSQGKRYDNTTDEKVCCNEDSSGTTTAFCCANATKGTDYYNTCHSCNPSNIPYLDDDLTKDLTRCCDFTKASLLGTDCCIDQGKGFDNRDQKACCNIGDGGAKTDFCCQFATKGTKFYNTCHPIPDVCKAKMEAGEDVSDCCEELKNYIYDPKVAPYCCDKLKDNINDSRTQQYCCVGDGKYKGDDKFVYQCCDFNSSTPSEECCNYAKSDNEIWTTVSETYKQTCFPVPACTEILTNEISACQNTVNYNDTEIKSLMSKYDSSNETRSDNCCRDESISGNIWLSGCCSYTYLGSAKGSQDDTAKDGEDFKECCKMLYNNTDKTSDNFKATFYDGSNCCKAWGKDAGVQECAGDTDKCKLESQGGVLKVGDGESKAAPIYYNEAAKECCDLGPNSANNKIPSDIEWGAVCCGLLDNDVSPESQDAKFVQYSDLGSTCCDYRSRTDTDSTSGVSRTIYYYTPYYAGINVVCPLEGRVDGCSDYKDLSKGFVCGDDDGDDKCRSWLGDNSINAFYDGDKKECCNKYWKYMSSAAKNRCCLYHITNEFDFKDTNKKNYCCNGDLFESWRNDDDVSAETFETMYNNITSKCCISGLDFYDQHDGINSVSDPETQTIGTLWSKEMCGDPCKVWLNNDSVDNDLTQMSAKIKCCLDELKDRKEYNNYKSRCCGNLDTFKAADSETNFDDLELVCSVCAQFQAGWIDADDMTNEQVEQCCKARVTATKKGLEPTDVNMKCCKAYLDGKFDLPHDTNIGCCELIYEDYDGNDGSTHYNVLDNIPNYRDKCCDKMSSFKFHHTGYCKVGGVSYTVTRTPTPVSPPVTRGLPTYYNDYNSPYDDDCNLPNRADCYGHINDPFPRTSCSSYLRSECYAAQRAARGDDINIRFREDTCECIYEFMGDDSCGEDEEYFPGDSDAGCAPGCASTDAIREYNDSIGRYNEYIGMACDTYYKGYNSGFMEKCQNATDGAIAGFKADVNDCIVGLNLNCTGLDTSQDVNMMEFYQHCLPKEGTKCAETYNAGRSQYENWLNDCDLGKNPMPDCTPQSKQDYGVSCPAG